VSLPALEAFAAKVGSDPQLRAKLDGAAGLDEVVAPAEAHGHAFSKATLLRAAAAMASTCSRCPTSPQRMTAA